MNDSNASEHDYQHMTGVQLNRAVEAINPAEFKYLGFVDDLNNAYELVEGLRYVHEHFPEGLPHNANYTDRVTIREGTRIIGVGEANVAARAIVIAWLYWKEATNE